jgi:predicted ABC-type exoprotein transport system permease subunit
MRKFNLNQRKALSELINNLVVSIIIVGIVTPIFSKGTVNSLNIVNIFLIILISLPMISFSNYMLK